MKYYVIISVLFSVIVGFQPADTRASFQKNEAVCVDRGDYIAVRAAHRWSIFGDTIGGIRFKQIHHDPKKNSCRSLSRYFP